MADAEILGKLYAVGGYDGASRQCLSTVEQYNPATNEWSYVSDMSTRRSGAGILSQIIIIYLFKVLDFCNMSIFLFMFFFLSSLCQPPCGQVDRHSGQSR